MSYDVDELFRFTETERGYALAKYLKWEDPGVTELEIPAEYNGLPVTAIGKDCFRKSYLKRVIIPSSIRIISNAAFYDCSLLESAVLCEGLKEIEDAAFRGTNLKSIVLPKSLIWLGSYAFARCYNLESVTFNSRPYLDDQVFYECSKLPADISLMGLVNSFDLSRPFDRWAFNEAFEVDDLMWSENERLKFIRLDVLELAIKNDCFRSVDKFVMLKFIIEEENAEILRFAGENGLFDKPELVDRCIKYSAELGKTEITAYLLDLKRRRFGFNGGDNFEL